MSSFSCRRRFELSPPGRAILSQVFRFLFLCSRRLNGFVGGRQGADRSSRKAASNKAGIVYYTFPVFIPRYCNNHKPFISVTRPVVVALPLSFANAQGLPDGSADNPVRYPCRLFGRVKPWTLSPPKRLFDSVELSRAIEQKKCADAPFRRFATAAACTRLPS